MLRQRGADIPMKRSPKLRPSLWDGLVVVAVVLLAVIGMVTIWGGDDSTAEIAIVVSVDGEEVERCPLTQFPDADQHYSYNGYTLTVTLTETFSGEMGVQVCESDCPTQDCVHTGTITRSGQSIVCLPARIIIQLEGGAQAADGPDLVIG